MMVDNSTSNSSQNPFALRRGTPADLPNLASLVDRAFAEEGQEQCALSRSLPHLFTPARAGNYWIAEWDGRMVATIGLYPYRMRVGEVIFETAGVGQVATLPEARGKGAMTSLLQAVCREADRYDFTWLYGDRLRYGRYGWAQGGWTYRFETGRRYLPPPPPSGAVERFDPDRHLARLQAALARMPQAVLMPEDELRLSLAGQAAQGLFGALLGGSFVLGRDHGKVVLVADGEPAELGALLANLATGRQRIFVDCGPEASALTQVGLDYAGELQVWPTASLRVGNLASFLEKAARLAGERLGEEAGEISLTNIENGQAATLACRAGKIQVSVGAHPDAYRLTTQQLSEICFGLLPHDLLLPGLPGDSPLRQALPARIFISEFFAL